MTSPSEPPQEWKWWVQTLLTPMSILVTVMLFFIDKKIEDVRITQRYEQTVITNYISDITNIWTEEIESPKLLISKLPSTKTLVQAKTSHVLFLVKDQKRRQAIIEFLRLSGLGFTSRGVGSNHEVNNLDSYKRDILLGLSLVRIEGIDLSGNDLSNIQLAEGKLNGANLKRASLSQSILEEAYLRGANLTESYLIATNLNNAILTGVKLNKANLTDANLENAKLNHADFKGAILRGANLKGANLGSSKNLTSKQIKSACNWEKATFKIDNKNYNDIKKENQEFIENLKKDSRSNPQKKVNCNKWVEYDE